MLASPCAVTYGVILFRLSLVTSPAVSAFPRDPLSSVLVNSAEKLLKFILVCHPRDGVTRGLPTHIVTPLYTTLKS